MIARRRCRLGVEGFVRVVLRHSRGVTKGMSSRRGLESPTVGGKSPVGERHVSPWGGYPSTAGHEESRGNQGGPPSKAKDSLRPIADKYREGKVKRTPGGE